MRLGDLIMVNQGGSNPLNVSSNLTPLAKKYIDFYIKVLLVSLYSFINVYFFFINLFL